jgi:hypothetical protein
VSLSIASPASRISASVLDEFEEWGVKHTVLYWLRASGQAEIIVHGIERRTAVIAVLVAVFLLQRTCETIVDIVYGTYGDFATIFKVECSLVDVLQSVVSKQSLTIQRFGVNVPVRPSADWDERCTLHHPVREQNYSSQVDHRIVQQP